MVVGTGDGFEFLVYGLFYGEGGEFFVEVMLLREFCHFYIVVCVVSISEVLKFLMDLIHFEFFTDIFFTYQYIILKQASSRWLSHLKSLSHPMLNTIFPFSLIPTAVRPVHFSVSMPHIIKIRSRVVISTRPSKSTVAILPIIEIVPLIAIPSLDPDPIAVPEPILEPPLILRPIPAPGILPHPLHPPIHIPARIPIPIGKDLPSMAMFHPRPNLPLIPRLMRHNNPQPLRFIPFPLPHIRFVFRCPSPRPMLHPTQKLTLVYLIVIPVEAPAALRLVIREMTVVEAVGEVLQSVAVLEVVLEGALVETGGAVEE